MEYRHYFYSFYNTHRSLQTKKKNLGPFGDSPRVWGPGPIASSPPHKLRLSNNGGERWSSLRPDFSPKGVFGNSVRFDRRVLPWIRNRKKRVVRKLPHVRHQPYSTHNNIHNPVHRYGSREIFGTSLKMVLINLNAKTKSNFYI